MAKTKLEAEAEKFSSTFDIFQSFCLLICLIHSHCTALQADLFLSGTRERQHANKNIGKKAFIYFHHAFVLSGDCLQHD